MDAARRLPAGTVTLLFTDIAGSTRMLRELGGERYVPALERHRRLLRAAFTARGGTEVEMQGDSFHFAFPSARAALLAAAEGQRALAAGEWEGAPIRVRIGLHTGEPLQSDGLYAGLVVHQAARVMSVAHGGQILVSERTAALVEDDLPAGLALRDLGTHTLKDIEGAQRLYQLAGDGLEADFAPLNTPEALVRRFELPSAPGPIVGRTRELAEAEALLLHPSTRLLTLVGPGGTGKTRLALELAERVGSRFRHGAALVDLSLLSAPEQVAPAVAAALAIRGEAGDALVDAIRTALREQELVLLLDNFESVLPAVPLVAELAGAARASRLLVTSRVSLALRAGREYAVPPLDEEAAVELLRLRAGALDGDRDADEELRALCRRLDCLPLAIELAAPRARALGPAALLGRLRDRLDLLATTAVDVPERQRTLRAAVDASYDILGERERAALAALGVFAGGFTLAAAESVCDADAELVQMLVEHSLLRRRGGRCTMLETIRQYALERLAADGCEAALRERHARYLCALVAPLRPTQRPRQKPIVDMADAELANLRVALAWALERGRGDLAIGLAAGVCTVWYRRGLAAEGRAALEAALGLEHDEPGRRADALEAASTLASLDGDAAAAEELAREGIDLCRRIGDRERLVTALCELGWAFALDGQFADAVGPAREAAEIASTLPDGWYRGYALSLLCLTAFETDPGEGRRLADESIRLLRAAGDEQYLTSLLGNLGDLAARQGELERAEALAEEGLAHARALEDRVAVGLALGNLGVIHLLAGRPGLAARRLAESLGEPATPRRVRTGNALAAACLLAESDQEAAARIAGTAEATLEAHGWTVDALAEPVVARTFEPLRRDRSLYAAWAEGRARSLEDAVADARQRLAALAAAEDASAADCRDGDSSTVGRPNDGEGAGS